MSEPVTLHDHFREAGGPLAEDLSILLTQLAVAGRIIARELARAALVGQLGTTGETNVQGEAVKKLDAWANDVLVRALEETELVTTLVSEEMDEPLRLTKTGRRGRYAVCVDPVDGSSNLDVNGVVGTIFSIRAAAFPDPALQAGTAQVAAGYIMYGPATLLVLTTGQGVDGFTLGPTIGEFVRSHRAIRMPARGRIYSVNEGNSSRWERGVQRYVADFHRTLLEGGIYLYPADTGKADGKLRLQYEAAPMAFIAEQAGGRASTGRERIMTIRPATPHQRVPLLVGSAEDVALAEDFIAGRQ